MNLYLDLENYQEIIQKKSYENDGLCIAFFRIKKPDIPCAKIRIKPLDIEKQYAHERKFSKIRHKLNLIKAALHELYSAIVW